MLPKKTQKKTKRTFSGVFSLMANCSILSNSQTGALHHNLLAPLQAGDAVLDHGLQLVHQFVQLPIEVHHRWHGCVQGGRRTRGNRPGFILLTLGGYLVYGVPAKRNTPPWGGGQFWAPVLATSS